MGRCAGLTVDESTSTAGAAPDTEPLSASLEEEHAHPQAGLGHPMQAGPRGKKKLAQRHGEPLRCACVTSEHPTTKGGNAHWPQGAQCTSKNTKYGSTSVALLCCSNTEDRRSIVAPCVTDRSMMFATWACVVLKLAHVLDSLVCVSRRAHLSNYSTSIALVAYIRNAPPLTYLILWATFRGGSKFENFALRSIWPPSGFIVTAAAYPRLFEIPSI